MRRLGLNKGGYFGERLEWQSFLSGLLASAESHHWQRETLRTTDDQEVHVLHRPAQRHPTQNIYISTGIHGDEPAGPRALRELIESDEWPESMNLWLWPCLNPPGCETSRRENAHGLDVNRDYLHFRSAEARANRDWLKGQPDFDLCLCLHEDWESEGFYLYELNPDQRSTPAQEVLRAVAEVCPIDHSSDIEGRPARAGLIHPNLDPRSRVDWPEAFYLIQNKTRLCYTVEAPSDFPLAIRIAALTTTVRTALKFMGQRGATL